MVQKYNPEIVKHFGWTEYEDYETISMNHSPNGEWVHLSTYQHETARLKAQMARLKKIIKGMKEKADGIQSK